MKSLEVGSKIGNNVVESITVHTRPSDEAIETIKEETAKEDYTLIIRSLNNGKEYTVGCKFTIIDEEKNIPQQYGDYAYCDAENLHETIKEVVDKCKQLKKELLTK